LNPVIPHEVQFDEHKLLIVYGSELGEYENTLDQRNITLNEQMKFITEAEHVHSSSDVYSRQFEELQTRLGMDGGFMMDE
jgi:hypothetical protein